MRIAKYCDEYVCLFVCLSARITWKTARPNFTQLFVHVACGSGSVILWRRCDMLCTSGFMDDVMFSYHEANEKNQAR